MFLNDTPTTECLTDRNTLSRHDALPLGTGFVHSAPGHGADDYKLGTANGIEGPHTVDADGTYFRHVPVFGCEHPARVLDDAGKDGDANGRVIATMIEDRKSTRLNSSH